jgi:hypothetical protein
LLPDIGLVKPCDQTNQQDQTNGDLAKDLLATRYQRDICAEQVLSIAKWRAAAAIKTAETPK